MSTNEVLEAGRRWAEAETKADVETLERIADDGFRLVGPFGFVLDKSQWLERYRAGDLVTERLDWEDVSVADHGDVAIAIGTQTQQATYRGQRADGAFRVTHVFRRAGDGWRLLGMHLSQAAPPRA
ncbi:MAG TPA: nuclear transport factor 2 family protein [Nocardioides sp.]|nr:nuclear transport factor 2 family protein [Nocardioides sp.]